MQAWCRASDSRYTATVTTEICTLSLHDALPILSLEKLQLREVALIAARVEGHEAISVNEGVCTDDEVGEQPLRFLCYSAASTGRIFRVPAAGFQPCLR